MRVSQCSCLSYYLYPPHSQSLTSKPKPPLPPSFALRPLPAPWPQDTAGICDSFRSSSKPPVACLWFQATLLRQHRAQADERLGSESGDGGSCLVSLLRSSETTVLLIPSTGQAPCVAAGVV